MHTDDASAEPRGQLLRRFGPLQATALNMSNMIGVALHCHPAPDVGARRPAGDARWLVAALIVIPDGLVWSELGAAMPGSGGSAR
jgi:amino acid transporter